MFRPALLPLEPRETPAFLIQNPAFAERFAVGGIGLNQPAQLVRLQPDGSLATELGVVPFPGFPGAVRVAAADTTGDGVRDLICAAGPGGSPHVKVFDGRSGLEVRSFWAYDFGFAGGVNVAAADVTGDGAADIITGAGAGGGPHVRVFDGRTNAEVRSFFAYTPSFTGGVSVAGGDLTLDRFADIATGAGPGGGPHVKVFDGRFGSELQSYFPFDVRITRGVNVAMGDVDNDGQSDLVMGLASGPVVTGGLVGPPLNVPTALVAFTGNPTLPSTFVRPLDPFGAGYAGEVRVGTADVDGDGRADALFAAGPGDGRLRVVFGRDIFAGNQLNGSVLTGSLFPGGLWVG